MRKLKGSSGGAVSGWQPIENHLMAVKGAGRFKKHRKKNGGKLDGSMADRCLVITRKPGTGEQEPSLRPHTNTHTHTHSKY